MSHPPDYPGRRRAQRAAASVAGDAYQGALEAVMAVLVGAGVGYWVDRRWQTTPYGVIVGVVIGFAAMVLRLLRMGRELHPGADDDSGPGAGTGADGSDASKGSTGPSGSRASRGDRPGVDLGPEADRDRGPAEAPALSDVWREEESDER